MGRSTVCQIIHNTTKALWDRLSPVYLKPPTEEKWLEIVEGFEKKWNFPNCLGAIDGKHVRIQAPSGTGSLYYNYKGFFSVVILAACDSEYQFTAVDVGGFGRQSDGGILSYSVLGRELAAGSQMIFTWRHVQLNLSLS